jgi:hypothetical protein
LVFEISDLAGQKGKGRITLPLFIGLPVERGRRIMKKLKGLFSRRLKKEEPEDVMRIARIIGPLADKTSNEVFISYREKLLTKPITYIVPAVWGAKKDGELEDAQKEINIKIVPVINELFDALGIKDLSRAQEYAIGFLIRGLIISKITYMIEAYKGRSKNRINVLIQPQSHEDTKILK